MRIIICLDDNNGMLFNNRRQSRDRVLLDDIFHDLKGERLCVFPFSQKLFADKEDKIKLVESLDEALRYEEKPTVFVENISVNEAVEKSSELIVYRWNRVYPADFYCDVDFKKFNLQEEREFSGSSHEKITKAVYKK